MGRLASHALDAARGCYAAGCEVEAWSHANFSPDTDGSRFFTSEYSRRSGIEFAKPVFLDAIPICFGIANGQPRSRALLPMSPYGYSTYRGS